MDDVYKVRLITQEWPHAAQSVKKLAASFIAFTRETSPASREKLYERFLGDIYAFEFAIGKLRGLSERCREEAVEYSAIQSKIGAFGFRAGEASRTEQVYM
jgi:hypothetical protein